VSNDTRQPLKASNRVTLDASGNGTIRIGPADAGSGPANWNVTGVIGRTNRPGSAPVPRFEVYLDREDESGLEGVTYDGSFAQGACDITMTRGQQIIAKWFAGKAGDIASITLSGWKW
jgi:hypothetical protein